MVAVRLSRPNLEGTPAVVSVSAFVSACTFFFQYGHGILGVLSVVCLSPLYLYTLVLLFFRSLKLSSILILYGLWRHLKILCQTVCHT